MSSLRELIPNTLQRCSFRQLKQIHALIFTAALLQNSLISLKLLRRSTDFGAMDHANLTFSQLGGFLCTDIALWNIMIRGYSYNGPSQNALKLFDKMRLRGLKPNHFTYPFILNACCQIGSLEMGKKVQSLITKSGTESGIEVAISLFKMYVQLGKNQRPKEAWMVFEGMVFKPIEISNQMIARLGDVGDVVRARQVFDSMILKDLFSWNSMISSYSKCWQVENAHRLFDEMPERNVVSWNSMVKAYAMSGNLTMAWRFFQQMPIRNLISWNCMIASCNQHGRFKNALELFLLIVNENVVSDEFTFASVLSACSHLQDLEFGKWIHYLINDFANFDIFLGTSLVEMYANCGVIDVAFALFIKIRNKDIFCFNVMIKSLANHGRSKDAIEVFFSVQEMELKPNSHTISSALFACSHGGMVEEGMLIFQNMEKRFGVIPNEGHLCSLVDLLCRNGRLEDAISLVKMMPIKADVAILGALLQGCKFQCDPRFVQEIIEMASELDFRDSGISVILSNIYALVGHWTEAKNAREKLEKMMKKVGLSSLVHS